MVLYNCSVHHVEGIVDMIHKVGALVHFLPPLSPNHNPIEEAVSKVEGSLKTMDFEANGLEGPEALVLAALSSITSFDCQQWIDHVGFCV